jgi:hypothetical protein
VNEPGLDKRRLEKWLETGDALHQAADELEGAAAALELSASKLAAKVQSIRESRARQRERMDGSLDRLPPRFGQIVRLSEIIEQVDPGRSLSPVSLACAILEHPESPWAPRAHAL